MLSLCESPCHSYIAYSLFHIFANTVFYFLCTGCNGCSIVIWFLGPHFCELDVLLHEREFDVKAVEAIYYMYIPDTSENYERFGRIYVWSGIYSDLIVMCVVVSV